jgi:hypothetical protein
VLYFRQRGQAEILGGSPGQICNWVRDMFVCC